MENYHEKVKEILWEYISKNDEEEVINRIKNLGNYQKEKVVILGSRYIGDIKRENIYLRTFVHF